MLLNKKGFIGSIGDDLPSLIPTFFAILIFFTGVAFAFNAINDKNDYLSTYLDSLTIAKSALGDGSFSSYDDFINTSKDLTVMSNYIFGVVYPLTTINLDDIFDDKRKFFITEFDEGLALYFNDGIYKGIKKSNNQFSNINNSSDYNVYLVTSENLKQDVDNDFTEVLENLKNKEFFQYVYPVEIYTTKGFLTAYLVIFVW